MHSKNKIKSVGIIFAKMHFIVDVLKISFVSKGTEIIPNN